MNVISNFAKYKLYVHYSILLLYVSFITNFLKNNPELSHLIISRENFVVLFISIVIQILFSYFLLKSRSHSIRFIYLVFIVCAFTFLNLTYLLTYLERLNIFTNGVIRVRFVLLSYFVLLIISTYYAAYYFQKVVRTLNVFLLFFIITGIFFTDFSYLGSLSSTQGKSNIKLKKLNSGIIIPEKTSTKSSGTKILFIVLDEYSSEHDLLKLTKYGKMTTSLNDYLLARGFAVISRIPTEELSTVNSINKLFNQGSGLTFKDKSIENVSSELREAFVVKKLAEHGYEFKNFGFFNIGGNKEFYYLYPFPRSNFEILFKNSMMFLVVSNLTFQNLTNFKKFQVYADYNKKLYSESLNYLNSSSPSKKELIYVHFGMPHPPFYSINEFSNRPVTLDNYIAYWNFSNKKIIDFLNSIQNLDSYKIIITGDHGYRRELRKLDPYITTSAFYNFEYKKLNGISSVQQIGKLLLDE